MTGEKCKELLSSVKFYDNREQLMYDVLLDILNAAFSMGYQKDIDTVCSICEKYGEISTTRIDDKNVSYINLNLSEEIKNKIFNLKYHVYNRIENDLSEKILCLK